MADEDGAVEWVKPEWWHKDFEAFEDWLIDGPAGKWPTPWSETQSLSLAQVKIVNRNAKRLADKNNWNAIAKAFAAKIASLEDADRDAVRGAFQIHFDQFDFKAANTNFANFLFPCSVTFAGAKFGSETVSFDRAVFLKGDVGFSDVDFGKGDVWFMQADFGDGDVSFGGAKFSGDVIFSEADFGDGYVWFSDAEFGRGAVAFADARFGRGQVFFLPRKVGGTEIYWPRASFAGSIEFRGEFSRSVDLSSCTVAGNASFAGSTFAEIPDFTDAKFDRPPDVAGMKVPRPKLSWLGMATEPKDVLKLRKLKSMALSVHDHEKDGDFFAAEMLAKRGTETKSLWALASNALYWWLSDFGQSFGRPVCWWIGSWAVFSGLNAWLLTFMRDVELEDWKFSAFLSLKNSIPLLGSLFRFAPAPEKHVSWFQQYYDGLEQHTATVDWLIGLGVVQNIFGGVLLFLFLLALRNRFRLK
ncbi:hypothetical protein E2A64_06025 [Pseudohoeflea suaedae]|uniref:Pentapeptide repeat-containing protein n=1 Tax=Pseudohoeflea suaedae TaxID=877384 RepID=A0A4R5PNL8_9HYPH|nr:pentapeptide repeat-containing protein [Pseudohoeflea suaedae]TDH38654.1 hypothetical protein E2A64_06025 [Pseudohoeflea suaedae]